MTFYFKPSEKQSVELIGKLHDSLVDYFSEQLSAQAEISAHICKDQVMAQVWVDDEHFWMIIPFDSDGTLCTSDVMVTKGAA